MKTTPIYEIPYPECDPPLVKDSSQITQMQTIARALDAQVERIDNLILDTLVQPAAARITTAALSNATTDTLVTPVFDQVAFFVNWGPGFVLDPSTSGMLMPETAWWMVGANASVDSAAAIRASVRVLVDGVAASSWGNPAAPYSGIFQLPALGMLPLQINAGSVLQMQIRHETGGSPAWNYRPHLWAVKLVAV